MSLGKELIGEPPGKRPEEGPESIYTRARRGWDDRLGSVAMQARNWRLATFALCGLCTLSTAGWLYQATRPVPGALVIQVERGSGVANVVGRLDNIAYIPQAPEIAYFLSRFVGLVRAVPLDPVVVKHNWIDAYQFLRQSAATQLDDWARQPSSALARLGEQTVATEIIAVTPVAGSKSYQVRWRETTYTKEGALKETYVMSGIFTLEFEPPRSEKRALVNPIGLFVKSFQWTREVTEAPPPAAAALQRAAPTVQPGSLPGLTDTVAP